jgi:HSP20 family protein
MRWPLASAMPDPLNPFNLLPGMLFNPFSGFGSLDRWFGDFSPGVVTPQLDVVDDGDALRITAELPGMDRDDIEVLLQDDILVIRGEKKQERQGEEKGCYRLERAFGSFQRVIPLPAGLDTDHAEAAFDKSVLSIRIPKDPKAGSDSDNIKKIPIK